MATEVLPLAVLKAKELLSEVSIGYSSPSWQPLADRIEAIRQALLALPPVKVSSSLAPRFVEQLGVPKAKAKFKFKSPESVDVVGSFAMHTLTKPKEQIDLAILIPKSCFHEKDFLKHRYHAKRALYLVVVKKYLKKLKLVRKVEWSLLQQDSKKPILVLHLGFESNEPFSKFTIRILPQISMDNFAISKLTPGRNNCKKEGINIATPHYNSSILEDMYFVEHYKYLKRVFSQFSNLQEAVMLLKIWLRQRGFIEACDSLNGFLISVILAHLTTDAGGRRINNSMTVLQIFRIFLEVIVNGNLLKNPIFLKEDRVSKMDQKAVEIFSQSYEVVMLDASCKHNLAFRLRRSAINEIVEEGSCTIAALKSSRDEGFDQVFLTPVDFPAKFDYHIRISPKNDTSESASVLSGYLDEDCSREFEQQVETIIRSGLGERVLLVRTIPRSFPNKWSIDDGVARCSHLPVSVGIKVSAHEIAFRMVDIGPSAEKKDEAAAFRAFWGEKAELRRFKDGRICETAVWECEPWRRHLIIDKIVEHVLVRHLDLPRQNMETTAGQLDFCLTEGGKDAIHVMPKLLEACDNLSKILRNIEGLPLKVSSVQSLSSAFRHAAVFPPQVHSMAQEGKSQINHVKGTSYIDPLDLMLKLEGSGKWPSNEVAVEKTKLAFCLQIAESLLRNHGIKHIASEDFVDILFGGFCFRLNIHYEKDRTLVKSKPGEKMAVMPAADLLHPSKDLLLRSLHAGTLNGLQGRYPLYSPTVRLAKRWVSSHMFSGVLCEELVELLVAHVFVKPAPLSAPSSRITGFLRFLLLLANHDWALNPLIIDVNGDMTSKDVDFIMDQFSLARSSQTQGKAIGASAMFLATSYDMESKTWSNVSPNNAELRRLVSFARSSGNVLKDLVKGNTQHKWQSLFRTPLHVYDVLLFLHRDKLPHPKRVLFPAAVDSKAVMIIMLPEAESYALIPISNMKAPLLVGFDPANYFLTDLKEKFGERFNFWYDHLGCEVIGLTWTKSQGMNTTVNGKRKRVETKHAALDIQNLLVEIGYLGKDLLKSVHLLPSPGKEY